MRAVAFGAVLLVALSCSEDREFGDGRGEAGEAGEAGAGRADGGSATDPGGNMAGGESTEGGAGGAPGAAGAPAAGAPVVTAGQGGGAGEGGSGPAPNCDPSAPFGKPALLFDSNTTKRSGARFWPDERSIYFATGGDLFRSTRASTIVLFGPGAPLENVNTANLELSPVLTRDGRTLYFDNSGLGLLQVATREDTSDDFGEPMDLASLEPYPAAPYLAGEDDVLYYDAFDDSFSDRHVWRAEITELGFTQSEIVIEEAESFSPSQPVVSRDELTLYLAVLTDSGTSRDIYEARRESVDDPFPLPTKVDELSTDGSDAPTWLSEDGCRIIVEADQNPYLAVKPR